MNAPIFDITPMTYWNYGVYADRMHNTVCYAASVRASSEREAVAALRVELKLIPMTLYIGPLLDSVLVQKIAPASDIQATDSSQVRLVRIDSSQAKQ